MRFIIYREPSAVIVNCPSKFIKHVLALRGF